MVNEEVKNNRNWFVTQYITYLNIWGAFSRAFSSLSTHNHEEKVLESTLHIFE
jgi:hypothetical protein